jgi:hypothetical protein
MSAPESGVPLNVPIKYDDVSTAPYVYFDKVGAHGVMNGAVQMELASRILVPLSDGGVEIRFATSGRLRCSPAAAAQLRDAAITYFVREKSLEQYREIRKVRLEFASRGGLDRFGITSYFNWLKLKSEEGKNFLPLGNLVWETIDEDLMFIYSHKERAGLQLADTVASAFFKACDFVDTGECNPEFAKLLAPRMCQVPDGNQGAVSGYSVKLMPNPKIANLLPAQAEIFTYYGYPRQWWAPTSLTNAASS